MRIIMLWGSNKFRINGKVQPEYSGIVYYLLPFLGPRLRNIFKFCVLYPERIWWKGSLRELNVGSAWPLKEGERAGLVLGNYFPLLFALLQLSGAGHAQEESEEPGRVLALPLTTCVTLGKLLTISGLSFSTGLLWGLRNMIGRNVLWKLLRSIKTSFYDLFLPYFQ